MHEVQAVLDNYAAVAQALFIDNVQQTIKSIFENDDLRNEPMVNGTDNLSKELALPTGRTPFPFPMKIRKVMSGCYSTYLLNVRVRFGQLNKKQQRLVPDQLPAQAQTTGHTSGDAAT